MPMISVEYDQTGRNCALCKLGYLAQFVIVSGESKEIPACAGCTSMCIANVLVRVNRRADERTKVGRK